MCHNSILSVSPGKRIMLLFFGAVHQHFQSGPQWEEVETERGWEELGCSVLLTDGERARRERQVGGRSGGIRVPY